MFFYEVVCICFYGIYIFLILCVFSNFYDMCLINFVWCKYFYVKCKFCNDDNDDDFILFLLFEKMVNVK